MDKIYKESNWKTYLIIAGIVIVLVTLWFTYSISNQLKAIVENHMRVYAIAYEELAKETDLNKDVEIPLKLIQDNRSIKILLVDEQDKIAGSTNFPENKAQDEAYLDRQLQKMKRSKFKPIEINLSGLSQKIYYAPPIQYTFLTYLPLVVLVLLSSFIVFGYLNFSASRKNEQNKVWVGMARETAHQLGTPISAILAWIENLKSTELDEEQELYIDELQKDVDKLDLVADRFSKIGSVPKLERVDLEQKLSETMNYMKSRAPKRMEFSLTNRLSRPVNVQINEHLFDWVIENLIRNAIDASDGKGQIGMTISEEREFIHIELSDTGKGIPNTHVKQVFRPGFTTKKRGWGLGLSLAKRIIENYHKGKIYVKQSKPGEGTTFAIELPQAQSTKSNA